MQTVFRIVTRKGADSQYPALVFDSAVIFVVPQDAARAQDLP